MPDVGPLENLEFIDRVTIVEKNIDLEKYYQNHYSKNRKE